MADERMRQIALAIQECVAREDRVKVKESKKSITVRVKTKNNPVDYKIIIMEDK